MDFLTTDESATDVPTCPEMILCMCNLVNDDTTMIFCW